MRPSPCREWQGPRNSKGYGVKYTRGSYGVAERDALGLITGWSGNRRGRYVKVHRWVWEQIYGPIPEGMEVCHRCDNPPCFLLEHLFLGTHADNMADAVAKQRFSGPRPSRF